MSGLQIGDKVSLTGPEWDAEDNIVEPIRGAVVIVTGTDEEGDPTFIYQGQVLSIYRDENYDFSVTKVDE